MDHIQWIFSHQWMIWGNRLIVGNHQKCIDSEDFPTCCAPCNFHPLLDPRERVLDIYGHLIFFQSTQVVYKQYFHLKKMSFYGYSYLWKSSFVPGSYSYFESTPEQKDGNVAMFGMCQISRTFEIDSQIWMNLIIH